VGVLPVAKVNDEKEKMTKKQRKDLTSAGLIMLQYNIIPLPIENPNCDKAY